jgi:hypothetical protein
MYVETMTLESPVSGSKLSAFVFSEQQTKKADYKKHLKISLIHFRGKEAWSTTF